MASEVEFEEHFITFNEQLNSIWDQFSVYEGKSVLISDSNYEKHNDLNYTESTIGGTGDNFHGNLAVGTDTYCTEGLQKAVREESTKEVKTKLEKLMSGFKKMNHKLRELCHESREKDEAMANLKHKLEEYLKGAEKKDEVIANLKCKLEEYRKGAKGKDEVIANLKCKLGEYRKGAEKKDEVIANLERELEEYNEELEETLAEYGAVLVEHDRKAPSEAAQLLQTTQLPQATQLSQAVQLTQSDEAWTSSAVMQTLEETKDKVVANLERELGENRNEPELETLVEFGRILVENDREVTKKGEESIFEGTFKSSVLNVSSPPSEAVQLSQGDEASTSGVAMQTVEAESPSNLEIQPTVPVVQEIPQNDVVEPSVLESKEESSSREGVSSTWNNYQLLLSTISDTLLSSDVKKFKEWAEDMFSVNISSGVNEGLLELDRLGVISASDLTNLRGLFEKLLRVDLVHLIDCFLQGDYTYLEQSVSSRKPNNPSSNTRRTQAAPTANPTIQAFEVAGLSTVSDVAARPKYDARCEPRRVSNKGESQSSSTQQLGPQVDMGSNELNLSIPARSDSLRNRNQSPPKRKFASGNNCLSDDNNGAELKRQKSVDAKKLGDGSQFCTQCNTKFDSQFDNKHLTEKKNDMPHHCTSVCRFTNIVPFTEQDTLCSICRGNTS